MATGPRCAFITNSATACTSSATERQSLCRTVATRPTSNATSNAVHGWPSDPEEKSEALTRWKVRVTLAHPRTREDVHLYLDACADENSGDCSLNRAAIWDIARAQNLGRLSRETGMTRKGLYKELSENGNPTFVTVIRNARALGMQLRITA